jgi:octanoyl-[GcvH]:protein N-octanoyltransferase
MADESQKLDTLYWFNNPSILIGDATEHAFARDHQFAQRAANGEGPFLHTWQAADVLVLGARDVTPHFNDIQNRFQQQGYHLIVRKSGGALVPLDAGVVNVSYVCAKSPGNLDADEDFSFLAGWLRDAMGSELVTVGEVVGSYCPGRFDLQINGRKVCGIAQRRYRGAVVVQAFINIRADGNRRATLAKQFYEHAAHSQTPLFRIQLDKVGSLEQFAGIHTTERFVQRLQDAAATRFRTVVTEDE